jgi:pullulanase-type alpha-1,6-glucosidase
MAGWLQDPTGSGLYTFSTAKLPAGTYQAQVTINRNPAETYGADGALGGSAISFTVPKDKQEAYFSYDANTHVLTINTEGKPKGDLGKAMGYWLQSDTLAWKVKPAEGDTFRLYYAADGGLQLAPGTVNNGQPITLTYSTEGLDAATLAKFPHLKGYSAFKLEAADAAKAGELLKGQVALVAFDKDGKISDATSLQIAGVLDDLYTYTGELGISYAGDTPTLRVWAPTAKNVTLHLFADAKAAAEQTFPMTVDPATGVWSLTGEASWTNQYYLYEVQVFVPRTGKVEKNLVTDPYSISLSMNSLRSQIVNLADSMLKPQDWDAYLKPALAAPEDTVIYELHIRDFSIQDETVPAGERGTYLAFTELSSDGMQHLQALAKAGLTHIHLLPAFDIASIDEDKSTWQTVDEAKLAGMPANSDEQQAAVGAIRDSDGFNWGYDPFHYTTPEGSYSTDPNGATRIVQFRQMVQALNQSGLRVVMDVVYNHTNASGQSEKSVLDKVVPGYYHRLNSEGTVETSTCCQNTATENAMMEKLMVDSVVTWAKYYKVDGFRFDLMGHHMVSNMVAVRQALDALTLAKDGVDGKSIILYGEGWDFGEVAKNARGLNAIQLNLGGTGIATFNDRLRDATRGGGPFNNVQEQGFITGLFDAPNDYDQGSAATMEQKLLKYEDWIRIGLAGNLKDYELVNYQGLTVSGAEIDYNGNPAGYTLDPQENILYISAHDNETLFDAIQYKAAADVSIEERVRMNNLGVSLVLLAQGMPFFHAGDDLLRSKSLDGNTYNSGDWFNKLDFTYQTNNWGVGLPNFGRDRLELMGKLLGNPDLMAKPTDIQFAAAFFQEMLQIRKSSPLFRLQTAEEVNARLSFLDTGDTNIPGLIVMVLDDMAGQNLDPNYAKIVVVFNAQAEPVQFSDVALMGLPLQLHPLQAASVDAQIKTAAVDAAGGILTVPGRAAVVFVLPEGAELVATATPAPTAAPTAVLTEAPTTAPTKAPTKAPALATATTAPQPTATTEAPTGLCGSLLGAVVLVLFGLGLKLWPKHG